MNWLDAALVFASVGALAMAVTQLRLNCSREARVARAMHELRNPLHSAMLVAEQPGDVDDRIAVHLRRCALALEQFEGGHHLAINGGREFDVSDVAYGVVRAWPGEANLRWTRADRAAPARGDQRLLEQAVSNLIANALEHGEGDVTISTSRARGIARVIVEDQGGGFQCRGFHRLNRPRLSERGHGLAIAATAIGMLGGRLTTASGSDGTAVAIELPLAPAKIVRPRGAETAIASAHVH